MVYPVEPWEFDKEYEIYEIRDPFSREVESHTLCLKGKLPSGEKKGSILLHRFSASSWEEAKRVYREVLGLEDMS